MKKLYELKSLSSIFIEIFLIFAVVKLLWSVVDFISLPSYGVEVSGSEYKASLYTSFKVAVPVRKRPPKRSTKRKTSTINLGALKLEGVYRDDSNPKKSIAIVSKAGSSKVALVGDDVFGFTLVDVKDKSVILESGDKEYELELPKSKVSGGSYTLAKGESEVPKKMGGTDSSGGSRGKNETGAVEEAENGEKIVSREVIDSYRKNMRKIWQNIGLSDYKKDGKLKGFRVRFVKKDSIFEELGLKQGDVITGINGEVVDGYSLPMKIFSNIGNIDSLILQVKRGNNEVELEYEIR